MKKIKKVRIDCEKTLVQAAKETGLSSSYISDLERSAGKNPSLSVLEKLAICYGVTIAELLDEQAETAIQAEMKQEDEEKRNWYQLHQRYYSTNHIVGELGHEHFSIDKAIDRGLCICSGQALCPCKIVQVVTTVVPRNSERMPFSIYVTVIAEPMIPFQKE